MTKHYVIDCDDVLLAWQNGFIAWVKPTHELNYKHPFDTWNMWEWFEDMSKQQFIDLVTEYNGYPRCLQPLELTRAGVLELSSLGHRLTVLTSFGSNNGSIEFRKDYLKIVYGDVFDDIVVLPLGECKEDKLIDLCPDVYIEDNRQHAEKAIALGIKTYLVSTTYNQGCEGAIYVNDFYAVCDMELKNI